MPVEDDSFERIECALRDVFTVDALEALGCATVIDGVIAICLKRHTGHNDAQDVIRVRRRVARAIRAEGGRGLRRDEGAGSLRTFLVVFTREVALGYIRGAHYPHSSIADVLRAMTVDVDGAQEHLDGLDQLFTPTQKCVLRLRYGEGCDPAQAARILGVSVEEVRAVELQASRNLARQWRALRHAAAGSDTYGASA
uniref:RNA polymerase sigma-70 region 4 domain-containing protein n=1 Tax=Fundidesulfovibrio putealis TaxID=270496 RepID=A0A7C4AHB3_9BACT